MSLSIVDKHQNNSHLHHFVVQTRSFQIEKARNVEMYENLRIHIERQNEKRKQEMEMSEELKRARREKELKHRRDKSTLSEVKEEIIKSQSRLEDLKAEKHRLFTEFKKILGEDEIRKTNQRIKEAEALKNLNMMNMTFGPAPSNNTTNASNQRPPHQAAPSGHSAGPIMPSSSHSNANILPSTLHHLHPIQPMFYSQQHGQAAATSANSPNISSASSSAASREQSRQEQSALGHHRLNGRTPTPTSYASTSFNSQGRQQPQIINQRSQEPPVSIYSNNKAPHQLHPGAPLSLTSMASSVSSAASIIPIPSSGATSYTSDRHRMSYKRSHEQSSLSSSGPSNLNLHPPTTAGGVISGQPGGERQSSHHQHYMHPSNYKHNLGQHSQQPPAMHQLPPGAFSQLGGHNLEHLQGLPTLPLYQGYLSQGYQPNNNSPYHNMDRK